MKTGLFFGSFNPVHIGHMAIANYFAEFTDCHEIWFVVSPHNPLKKKTSLLGDYQRLELVNLAIGDDPRFKASDIEFNLPQPSYTIDTLTYLREKYPSRIFILIMGSDNLDSFEKWKNYERILETCEIYVYPRPGIHPEESRFRGSIKFFDAPLMEVSSSFIRDSIRKGKDMRQFLPEKVYQYITEMNFYRK
jgi:nicotinate-nucleotide adenylyltransferase